MSESSQGDQLREIAEEQTRQRHEQQRQQQELDEIRRSFTEMGARMGSLFEPAEESEEMAPGLAMPRVRHGSPEEVGPLSLPQKTLRWLVNAVFIGVVVSIIVLILRETGAWDILAIGLIVALIILYSVGAFPPKLRRKSLPPGRSRTRN